MTIEATPDAEEIDPQRNPAVCPTCGRAFHGPECDGGLADYLARLVLNAGVFLTCAAAGVVLVRTFIETGRFLIRQIAAVL